jgi:hypothetical protein
VTSVLERVFSETDNFGTCSKRLTVPTLNVAKSPARLHTFRNYRIAGSHNDAHVSFRDAARGTNYKLQTNARIK